MNNEKWCENKIEKRKKREREFVRRQRLRRQNLPCKAAEFHQPFPRDPDPNCLDSSQSMDRSSTWRAVASCRARAMSTMVRAGRDPSRTRDSMRRRDGMLSWGRGSRRRGTRRADEINVFGVMMRERGSWEKNAKNVDHQTKLVKQRVKRTQHDDLIYGFSPKLNV